MLDAHSDLAIPPETHFVPDVIQRAREIRTEHDRKPTAAGADGGDHLQPPLGGLPPRRGRAARERMVKRRGSAECPGRALRAFYDLYAEAPGQVALGRQDARLPAARSAASGGTLPEARFVHLVRDGRDVALSRRRWRERAGAEERPIEAWASQWQPLDRRRPQAGRRRRALPRGPLRGPRHRHRADAAARLRVHRARLPAGDARLPRARRERLRELDHSLPAEDGKGAREAEHRQAKHALTAAPPQESKVAEWRTEMSEEDRRGVRGRGGRAAGGAGLSRASGPAAPDAKRRRSRP